MRHDIIEAFDLQTDEEYEIQAREADEFIARTNDPHRRDNFAGDRAVVFKHFDPAEARPVATNSGGGTMTPEQQEPWENWLRQHLDQHSDMLADAFGAEVGKITREERKLMREYIADELRKLRDELRPPEDDKVLDWPGKRNVA